MSRDYRKLRVFHESHAKLAGELGFAKGQDWLAVQTQCEVVARQLQRLIERMEALAASEGNDR